MPGLRQGSSASTETVPADASRKPDSRCSKVLLPAPFGPSKPVIPGATSKEMPFTATTFPYQRDTSRTAMVAPGGVRCAAPPRASTVTPVSAGSG